MLRQQTTAVMIRKARNSGYSLLHRITSKPYHPHKHSQTYPVQP